MLYALLFLSLFLVQAKLSYVLGCCVYLDSAKKTTAKTKNARKKIEKGGQNTKHKL